MQMIKGLEKKRTVLAVFILGLALLLLCDLVLSFGGSGSLMIHLHPALPLITQVYLIGVLVMVAFQSFVLIVNRQWVKALIIVSGVALLLIGSKHTVDVLSETNKVKALDFVRSALSDGKDAFVYNIEPDVSAEYKDFLSEYDESSIKLDYSFPQFRRYDFTVTPKGAKPFAVTLWMANTKKEIWVHRENRRMAQ